MILAIKTAEPTAEIYVLDKDGQKLAEKIWSAERRLARELLGEIQEIVGGKFDDLTGLIVFRGPGSFTGLRIGITTMNALAYAENIPIVGTTGEDWRAVGVKRIMAGENDQIVLPEYGAAAHITKPKK